MDQNHAIFVMVLLGTALRHPSDRELLQKRFGIFGIAQLEGAEKELSDRYGIELYEPIA